MVFPYAVDLQQLPGLSLDLESQFIQQFATSPVPRQIIGHDTVQPDLLEYKRVGVRERLEHETLALVPAGDSVAQVTGFESSPDDIGVIANTKDLTLLMIEYR